jgi:hypothetical protein
VLILAVACSAGDDGTGPENTPANGSMSARIDGSSWTSTLAVSAGSSGGIIAISGTNGSTTIAMAFGVANGPATFQIGPAGAISNALLMESNGRSWHALSTVGNGTVTHIDLSDGRSRDVRFYGTGCRIERRHRQQGCNERFL